MLSHILPLLFVTQVFARSTTDCLSINKFKSGDLKIVKGNWTYRAADEEECSDTRMTVTDATPEDIKEIRDHCNGVLAELTWKANAKDNFYWDESIKKLTFSNKYNDTLVSAHNGEFFILWKCAKIEKIELLTNANASVLMLSKLTPMAVQLPEGKTEVCITDNPDPRVTSTNIAYFEKYFQECNSASSFIIGHFSWVLGLVNIVFVRYVMSSM